MNKLFVDYLDPKIPIEQRLYSTFKKMEIPSDQQNSILAFLDPIKVKDEATYKHSIRVGILASCIAHFMRLDEKALLYSGLLHDIGKTQTQLSTLQKTENWTPADTEEIKNHVLDGYRMIRGYFDFSAEVILWHHRFQIDGYPKKLPTPLHEYSEGSKVMIALYGRILSLADHFDASHRINSKFGPLTGEEIKEKMLKFNPDQKALIERLYKVQIFTTKTY
jgi:putative nucleotidyltransferase with HDIG domain